MDIPAWISEGVCKLAQDQDHSKSNVSSNPRTESIYSGKTEPLSEQSQEEASIVSDQPLEPEAIELLVGLENDFLIPSPEEISNTIRRGRSMWLRYVNQASLSPPGTIPSASFDPYMLLQRIPALPQGLPRRRNIRGEAVWEVACPELRVAEGQPCHVAFPELRCDEGAWDSEVRPEEAEWNPELVHGAQKSFSLTILEPTQLRLSSEAVFQLDNDQSNLVAVLTALWSYIFSVRFLELQGRKVRYSQACRATVVSQDARLPPADVTLHLGCASRGLTRWLAAVLAPGKGWLASGYLPPWVAHFSESTRFTIVTDTPILSPHEKPPTSTKAADLLLEFCMLFSIGSIPNLDGPNELVPQPIAAFLAVLALPLYNSMGLQPLLPMPKISKTRNTHLIPPYYVRKYTNDLAFYMTLSICPDSVGSIIWSIFWEPGLNCNVSSAWFTSILEVLNPIIKAGDFEALIKVFMARRRSTALLWFGVLFLGDRRFLEKIVSYLETHDEQPGDSWSRPDVNVAVWTGSKQSFLDEPYSGTYNEEDTCVSRSDLVRHRFNYRLYDPNTIRYGWQPNGYMMKAEIERELWPRLASNEFTREYKYWVWWIPRKDGDGYKPNVQPGFLHETKHPEGLPGNMQLEHIDLPIPTAHRVRIGPSRDATFSIVAYGATDATGDRSLEAMGQGIRDHPWMAGSRGA